MPTPRSSRGTDPAIETASRAASSAALAASAVAAEEAAEQAAASAMAGKGFGKQEMEDALESLWAARTAPFLKVLGDVNRFRIILFLRRKGTSDVGAISRGLRIPQSRTSQHLGRLAKAQLVSGRREGQMVRYSLNRSYIDWKMNDMVRRLAD